MSSYYSSSYLGTTQSNNTDQFHVSSPVGTNYPGQVHRDYSPYDSAPYEGSCGRYSLYDRGDIRTVAAQPAHQYYSQTQDSVNSVTAANCRNEYSQSPTNLTNSNQNGNPIQDYNCSRTASENFQDTCQNGQHSEGNQSLPQQMPIYPWMKSQFGE
jgi:hypothetical protein